MSTINPFMVALRILADSGKTPPPQVADWILSTKVPDDLSRRTQVLMEKSNDGTLSQNERQELAAYSDASAFISLLKAKLAPGQKKKIGSKRVHYKMTVSA